MSLSREQFIQLEQDHYAQVYQKFPVVVDKGRSALVWDTDGKEYIDCLAGYGVALVGHCNPRVVSAIKEQADRLITAHSSLYNPARSEMLLKLAEVAPKGLESIFLSNSGAEANECAVKLARKHTGRKEIISFTGGYHGKTSGALSLTWNKKYRDPFVPLLENVHFAKYGNVESVREVIGKETAAIVVEPLQGESGVQIPPDDFLPQLQELCHDSGALLIVDEIQSGLGRTGKFWASEHWNVIPDIVTVAKGLAGGLPIGATLSTREVMSSLKTGEHSSTFGGNPLCCAAASATLDYIVENNLPFQAEEKGRIFKDGLSEIQAEKRVIRETRGLGLMLAAESRFEIKDQLHECVRRGLLSAYSGRNIIRLLPPLVIKEEQIKQALSIIRDTTPEIPQPIQINP